MQVPTDGHPQARWGWGGEAAGEGGSNPGHWALGSSLPPSPGPPPAPDSLLSACLLHGSADPLGNADHALYDMLAQELFSGSRHAQHSLAKAH